MCVIIFDLISVLVKVVMVKKKMLIGRKTKGSKYVTPTTAGVVSVDNLKADLRRKWGILGNPISFAGISKIYDRYRKRLSKEQIMNILTSISTYTRHKEVKRPKTYNSFFIYFKHHQWQLDITYLNELSQWNDGIKYLLVVIECFSRKLFVRPMVNKTTESTIRSFDDIHTHIGSSPVSVYTDRGLEFNSHAFKDYCAEYNIKPIFCHSSTKAACVERSQRTLKGIMHKFVDSHQTKRYINILSDIVASFNSRVNRSIKMSPNDAYEDRMRIKYQTIMKYIIHVRYEQKRNELNFDWGIR